MVRAISARQRIQNSFTRGETWTAIPEGHGSRKWSLDGIYPSATRGSGAKVATSDNITKPSSASKAGRQSKGRRHKHRVDALRSPSTCQLPAELGLAFSHGLHDLWDRKWWYDGSPTKDRSSSGASAPLTPDHRACDRAGNTQLERSAEPGHI